MSRKIVICPSFAETHLIRLQLQNLVDTIQPDIVIYNEGLFSGGPEGRTNVDDDFRKKWCNSSVDNENVGFDWPELMKIQYEYNYWTRPMPSPLVIVNRMEFKSNDPNKNFIQSATFGLEDYVEQGCLIFTLEPDAFHLESQKDLIQSIVGQLKPGEGIKTKWVDFLETQFYIEAININQPKYRRFCYCYDTLEGYVNAINGFTSQQYPLLKQCDDFTTFHYSWWRPNQYKQLRYELIHRNDPQYWSDFDKGLNEIREMSQQLVDEFKSGGIDVLHPRSLLAGSGNVEIRPSRTDDGRWAKFIDIDHPKAIQNHPNFVK